MRRTSCFLSCGVPCGLFIDRMVGKGLLRRVPRHGAACAAVVGVLAVAAAADQEPADWLEVPVIRHADYQVVNPDGSSAYAGGFPVRLVGVVVNHTEDWLDPTPSSVAMGGQAEFFLQAVDLDGTPWDPFPGEPFDDFGGTACWIGQNYGNLPFVGDPDGSYTDEEWTAELGRLGLFGGDGVVEPLRAGDLIELRARGGLFFQGKMNVNEQHSKSPSRDFEIVVLRRGFGLPSPPPLLVGDLKTETDEFVFDATRQTGGEYFQGSRVRLLSVRVTEEVAWTPGAVFAVTDGARTMNLRLGVHPGFDGGTVFSPGSTFDVTGILNQASLSGTDGYQVLVMNAADCVSSPDGLAIEILAGQAVVRWPANLGGQLLRSPTMVPESWLPEPGGPVASGGMQVHREPVEDGRMFFKLGEP